MSKNEKPFRVFDPNEEVQVTERRLPHWSQAGTLCFLTWRTWDSMPKAVLERWFAERDAWLRKRRINPVSRDWKSAVEALPIGDRREFQALVCERWQDSLDECHGSCVLRRPEFTTLIADSLRYFDDERYWLADFVVMPNHVHVLCAFADAEMMLSQCESWKHFTAAKINRSLNRHGRFWQQDGYDRLVRSEDEFQAVRQYIADNPIKAKLSPGTFAHFSKPS